MGPWAAWEEMAAPEEKTAVVAEVLRVVASLATAAETGAEVTWAVAQRAAGAEAE